MTDPSTPGPAAAADDSGISVTGSGAATASRGGVAVSGVIAGDVTNEYHEHHHAPPAEPVVWPVQIGRPPALASAFQPREALREQILSAHRDGEDLVLAQRSAGVAARVLAGGGGVGKTQLAAWFARHAMEEQNADLVMWVPAGTEDQVIALYARAAVRLSVPGADGASPAEAAEALREWLHTTRRRWLIVLDDVTDPADLAHWWPPAGPHGWTLATTRLRTAALTGGGRRRIDIDVYSADESIAYLTERLTSEGLPHLLDDRTGDLAEAVGRLPLALAHAAAYMINEAESCGNYLDRYTSGRQRLIELMPVDADPDAYGRPVDVTLLLNLQAADRATPVGLARPALDLAALLDPAGHPDTLWTTGPVTAFLTTHRADPGGSVTADQGRAALRLLHRYGLLTHAPIEGPRAVRIHALTARAAREQSSTDAVEAAHAVADALVTLWPASDRTVDAAPLVESLRANATALHANTGTALWQPNGHELLFTAGISLLNAGLPAAAVTHWQTLTERAHRHLGPAHPDSIHARGNLAASYWQAGRTADAIAIQERVVADSERIHGFEHPETILARANLAAFHWQADRSADAIAMLEKAVADSERMLGSEHPHTIRARANLATSYGQAGRSTEAITIVERVVAEREQILGAEHPDTIRARSSLAASYWQAGRFTEAITIVERVAAEREQILGAEHLDTVRARANLAASYWQAGRFSEAITIQEHVVADRRRVLGPEHPDTIAAAARLRAWTSST
ncbi:tetratricopeptide repeat protein [Dactylosporangium sp. NPDC000521]|uniref:tetratricopeptide repeat protein n=1 Tax=Dactylosporangium sp. NPDC000521 TaxID=3363975 RepID=UPI0036A9D58D